MISKKRQPHYLLIESYHQRVHQVLNPLLNYWRRRNVPHFYYPEKILSKRKEGHPYIQLEPDAIIAFEKIPERIYANIRREYPRTPCVLIDLQSGSYLNWNLYDRERYAQFDLFLVSGPEQYHGYTQIYGETRKIIQTGCIPGNQIYPRVASHNEFIHRYHYDPQKKIILWAPRSLKTLTHDHRQILKALQHFPNHLVRVSDGDHPCASSLSSDSEDWSRINLADMHTELWECLENADILLSEDPSVLLLGATRKQLQIFQIRMISDSIDPYNPTTEDGIPISAGSLRPFSIGATITPRDLIDILHHSSNPTRNPRTQIHLENAFFRKNSIQLIDQALRKVTPEDRYHSPYDLHSWSLTSKERRSGLFCITSNREAEIIIQNSFQRELLRSPSPKEIQDYRMYLPDLGVSCTTPVDLYLAHALRISREFFARFYRPPLKLFKMDRNCHMGVMHQVISWCQENPDERCILRLYHKLGSGTRGLKNEVQWIQDVLSYEFISDIRIQNQIFIGLQIGQREYGWMGRRELDSLTQVPGYGIILFLPEKIPNKKSLLRYLSKTRSEIYGVVNGFGFHHQIQIKESDQDFL